MATSVDSLPQFPVSSLLPRKETGVLSFLSKYPKCDGTGIIIAVFDSGVDPAAPGLQVCSSGDVKVLDRLDCSGAGDVDTSVLVHAEPGSTVVGVSGRALTIPVDIHNPSGEYHLGVKPVYSLYPTKLKDKIIKERKEQMFDPQFKKLQEDAMRRLQQEKQRAAAAASVTSPTEDTDTSLSDGGGGGGGDNAQGSTESDGGVGSGGPTAAGCQSSSGTCQPEVAASEYSSFLEQLQKEETEAEVALLSSLQKKYCDLGPAYDCVVYHDGTCWRGCIDTSEVGDLSSGVDLGEYRFTREWQPLTARDAFTITINVHNDGNLLEIVGMCSSHGTHVASIASACFPDDPDRNGVAPGAQIVSVTIGDNRVHGMETGTALSRAMSWVMDNEFYKVDVINMSYGEHSHTSLAGRLGDLASEVVNKYGLVWIASASNHGPALSTVGTPPDFSTDSIMGIGAYISPDMMQAGYSLVERLPGTAYTWSSRGPTADGCRGVSVCAPGGAITSMPAFTNKTSQLLNGTSMAAPHAAGCVALLMSGLKQKDMGYSPYFIRRAMQNTALTITNVEVLAQGHGLIQMEKAFDYLTSHCSIRQGCEGRILPPLHAVRSAEAQVDDELLDMTYIEAQLPPPENNMRFLIECGSKGQKGIYLRNWLANKVTDISVSVEPLQHNDARADDGEKRRLNLDLVLSCEASWVSHSEYLHMSYTSRSFVVRINPLSLTRGQVYFTCIRAYVAGAPESGPLFEVPVTVVIPVNELEHGYLYKSPPEVYRAGCVRRSFLRVPDGATWAQFHIKSSNSDQNQRIMLHAVQLFPQYSVLTYDHQKTFSCLYPHELSSSTFAVCGGLTLEVCVARWWAAMHDTTIEYTVSFHSLKPSTDIMSMFTNNHVYRVNVESKVRTEDLCPQATIRHHAQSLAPYESRIEVLGRSRDTIPCSRPVYQLLLSYTFSISKTAEVQLRCGLLNDYLYESPVESQLWMLFDARKQHIGSGDAYSHKYPIKLDKGEYIIKQHVRHEKTELLEKLVDMPMTVITKMPLEVKLDVYGSFHGALTGTKKMVNTVVQTGDTIPVFFSVPNVQEKIFKCVTTSPGHFFMGTVSFAKDEHARRAVTYPLRIIVTENSGGKKRVPVCATDTDTAAAVARKEPRTQTDYNEALRDLNTSWIGKLDPKGSESLYRELLTSHKLHLPAHVARAQALDSQHTHTTANKADQQAQAKAPDATADGGGDSSPVDLVVVEAAGEAEGAAVAETSGQAATTDEGPDVCGPWVAGLKEVADNIEACIDVPGMLAYLGTKMDVRADAAKHKTQMDRQKSSMIESYSRLGQALAHPFLPTVIDPPHTYGVPVCDVTVPPPPPDAVLTELDSLATAILKLTEPSDAKASGFFTSYYQVRRLYATAARMLQKQIEDKLHKDSALRLATLFTLLGYEHMVSDIFRSLPIRFPDKYTPF